MKTWEDDAPMTDGDVEAALRLLLDIAIQATPNRSLANDASEIQGEHLTKRKRQGTSNV